MKSIGSFHARLSLDEVDKRCRRVPNDAPDILPLSTRQTKRIEYIP